MMGYSCTVKAELAREAMVDMLQGDSGEKSSNGWPRGGKRYFVEQGREQADGAITGVVLVMLDDGRCRRAGNIRIEHDGVVTRWPTSTADERRCAYARAMGEYIRRYNPHITFTVVA
jgi:hypothetical protein